MSAVDVPPVIKLEGVTKVFSTDEVDTHALATVDIEIARDEYVSIAGPSVCDGRVVAEPMELAATE